LDAPLLRGNERPSAVPEKYQAVEQLEADVGTTNMSTAAIPAAWLRKKVDQL
jgi:hypothetical protein